MMMMWKPASLIFDQPHGSDHSQASAMPGSSDVRRAPERLSNDASVRSFRPPRSAREHSLTPVA